MTVSSINTNPGTKPVTIVDAKATQLGQADFLKLLTTQMTQQDPTDPVDNKEMIAQMAQFQSLAATTDMSDTLKSISTKLDTLISAQTKAPANPAS